MLDLIGDILNWAAAGVLFPLMLLPLASLFREAKAGSVLVWMALVIVLVFAGIIFGAITPTLREAPDASGLIIFTIFCAVLFALVFLIGGASTTARWLLPIFERITTGAGRAVMWLLLVMALVQFTVVLLRYVFGINSLFMQESITYMHGIVFLIAGGYALLTNDHVRVDIFYREAPPKRKAVIDLMGTYLFLFPICLLILWTASPYVARSWAFFEGSADSSGIQGVFLLKSLIPAFALLLSMAGFVNAHKAVEVLKGRTG